MEQEDLQYEESTEEVAKGGDSYTEGEEQQLNDMDQSIETELESIKARVREMEDEAEKLRQIQTEVDKQMNMGSPPSGTTAPAALNLSLEEKMEVDARSIYVGNVDYGATAEDLEQHFHGCGAVNRVTILCNKFDGHPKGFAYVEFSEKDSVHMAMTLDESLFKGRQLKVMPKRTNKHGITTTHRPPRRAMRPRRRAGFSAYRGAMRRPRGRRFFYSPY